MDMTPTERAFTLAMLMMREEGVTVTAVADKLNMTASGARRLIKRCSRVAPVYQDGSEWRLMRGCNATGS